MAIGSHRTIIPRRRQLLCSLVIQGLFIAKCGERDKNAVGNLLPHREESRQLQSTGFFLGFTLLLVTFEKGLATRNRIVTRELLEVRVTS